MLWRNLIWIYSRDCWVSKNNMAVKRQSTIHWPMTQMKTDLLAFAKAISDFKPHVWILVVLASQNPCDRPVDHQQRKWLTFGHMHSHRKGTCTLTNKHTHTYTASQKECFFPLPSQPPSSIFKKQWKHNEVKAAHTERRVRH